MFRGRIHEKPGCKEHADGQQDHSKVGEHSRVHRTGVSRHSFKFLQLQQKQNVDMSRLDILLNTIKTESAAFGWCYKITVTAMIFKTGQISEYDIRS